MKLMVALVVMRFGGCMSVHFKRWRNSE